MADPPTLRDVTCLGGDEGGRRDRRHRVDSQEALQLKRSPLRRGSLDCGAGVVVGV